MAETIIVLDIAASKTGALSILRDFYNCINKNPDGNRWIFVTGVEAILDPPSDSSISIICRSDVKASPFKRLKFELADGAGFLKKYSPDVVFSLQNTLPKGLCTVRTVLYVHQPLGYQQVRNFSLLKKNERHLAVYQHLIAPMIDSSVRRSDVTIVQTEWMRKAVVKKTRVKEEKVVKVTPEVPDISAYMKSGEWKRNEFFYPAGDILYKNHDLIRTAVKKLEAEGYRDINVHFTLETPMEREQVFEMYNKCTLLFPSYIETFGLPLAEAEQSGNPILSADTPFAREILQGYSNAFFFDPFDASCLAALMKDVLDGKIVPAELKAGQIQAYNTDSYREIVKIITDENKNI